MDVFILNLITLQLQLRFWHWQTNKHSEHIALGAAYEMLDSKIDSFVEVYQGKYGKVHYNDLKIEFLNYSNNNNIQHVLKKFTTVASQSLVNSPDTDLHNLRDEIIGIVSKLRYLITLE